jgi:putative transposase
MVELIHHLGLLKTKEADGLSTLEWLTWFKHTRLLEPIEYISLGSR